MTIPVGKFFLLYFAYILISAIGFVATSSGWSSLFYFGFSTIFFVLSLFAGIFVVIYSKKTGRKELRVSRFLLKCLIFVQLFIVLFNFGDCGDSDGASNFIQRILGLADCSGGSPWIHGVVILILMLIYLGLLSCLLIGLFISRKVEESVNQA